MEQMTERPTPSPQMERDSAPALAAPFIAVQMPETEQHLKTPPRSPFMGVDSAPALTTHQYVDALSPEMRQHLNTPPRQILSMTPAATPTTRTKTATRADWVNALWADVSGQLRRFSVISTDLFDGLLLKRDTATGSLILRELRNKYEELCGDRFLATVRVMAPQNPTDGVWQLLWTIKRHRDPNGRRFRSQTTIDPIGAESHLELQTYPDQAHSHTTFSLPPFIQDYGPGPSEFDPAPDFDFDALVEELKAEVDAGKWDE